MLKAITVLKRCRASADELERLETQIWQRRDAMSSLRSPQPDPDGGSHGTGDPDKIGRLIGDIDDLERRADQRRQDQAVETAASCALLDMLPDLESRVLYGYYVKRQTTAQVARQQKYQEAYVRKVKRRAEAALALLSEERVRSTLPRWYLEREEGEQP